LKAHHVEDGDLATITELPYIQPADQSQFGKERTIVTVQIQRTGQLYRWSLNVTSNDRLVDQFGSDGDTWMGKEVRVQKRREIIRGEERYVVYAVPSLQQSIAPPGKPAGASDTS